jgi:rRNA pseudouridine-1189 N-methylase Emg1 (Nep1/Mra1 family)
MVTCTLHADVFVYHHVNRSLIIRNSNSNNVPKNFIKNIKLFQKVHDKGWMTEESEFESQQGQEVFLFSETKFALRPFTLKSSG